MKTRIAMVAVGVLLGLPAAVFLSPDPQHPRDECLLEPDLLFHQIMVIDQDSNGQITRDEQPPPLQRVFAHFDADKDGAIDEAEADKMSHSFPQIISVLGPNSHRTSQPAWVDVDIEQATHVEVAPLPVAFSDLNSLRLRSDGNLLAADLDQRVIKVINPLGDVIDSWSPGFRPEVLALASDDSVYVGGDGCLAKLSPAGQVIRKVDLPGRPAPEKPARRSTPVTTHVSGLAVSDDAVFATFGAGWSVSAEARLYRFDRELDNPKKLAEGLHGCCEHCDICFHDGVLYLAENSVFRVVRYDQDGNVLGKWGSESRDDVKLFGGCCNPMNLAFDAAGVLYTGESGLGRVKRYTPDGQFLGLVGYVDVQRFDIGGGLAAACCHFPLAVTPDGARIYVTDVKRNIIRVLQRRPST